MEAIARDQDRVWSSKQGELAEPAPGRPRPAPSVDFAKIGGAKADKLPSFVEPSLPSTVEKAPSGGGWIHEIKYDGYRIQIRLENGRATLLTRQGIDWTERFPSVAKAAAALPLKSALIDSEVVVESEAGVASHVALVEALKSGARSGFVVHAFDLLHADGFDLRAAPLIERKAALAKVLEAQDADSCIRFSDHIDGDGDVILRHVCRLGLEGVVSKKASSPYRSGRVKTWLKIRCVARGDFVIAGYVPSSVAKNAVGALVLGEHVGGKLVAAGHVGTGFGDAGAKELWQLLDPLATKTPAFKDETAEGKKARWVEPRLVADVEYRGRTSASLIWHASYKGLIEGKRPSEVVRPEVTVLSERPKPAPSVRLTNPARLLWPEEGVTKQGLVDFYTGIADWILPHIAGRPLSLLRCPGGVHEQCFFQKHRWAGLGQAVRLVPIPGDDEPMVAIDDLAGLLELVQAGVLEIHPWGSRTETPELPDRITIDLDPGEDVPWEQVIAGALDVRARLSDMGLRSFVKTTGGKGLHVVLPISPGPSWEAVKAFALSLSERMAAESPDRYTDNMAKRVRHGRIYVDYLRNGMGATAVAAYSTRARPGAAVSTPLAWDELGPKYPRQPFYRREPADAACISRRGSVGRDAVAAPGAARRSGGGETEAPEQQGGGNANVRGRLEESIQSLIPDAVAPPKSELAAYWSEGRQGCAEASRAAAAAARPPCRRQDLLSRRPAPAACLTPCMRWRSRSAAGGEGARPWVDSVEGLLGLLEIDVVELHPWGATVDDVERPDMLVFNLDPDEAAEWPFVIETALRLREVLRAESLDSWPKLTGGKSVHVMVPVEPDLDWEEAHDYCRDIAERLAATAPDRYTTSASKAERPGRLFIDWLRNGRGMHGARGLFAEGASRLSGRRAGDLEAARSPGSRRTRSR